MSDFGDAAAREQDRHLRRSLSRLGIRPRDIEIPPPNYDTPAFCRVCGGLARTGTLCAGCAGQIDKGGR